MNHNIVLVAETGSDLTPALAAEYGVYLVPMHVSMGMETLDDGAFPVERVCEYYDRTGKVPQTSASGPADFERVFDEIHQTWPEKQILHMAYSAVTTCSYQNALLAAEGRGYVTSVDTKHVSAGQATVVLEVARFLSEHPDCGIQEAADYAQKTAAGIQMCFIPRNLDYLRAGGRVSNVVALTGNLLGLHPCIEILGGKLMAKKKYRGTIDRIIPRLIRDFSEKHALDKKQLYLIWSPGLSDVSRSIAEETVRELGFERFTWVKTGCVITSHGGPGCFGIVGAACEGAAE